MSQVILSREQSRNIDKIAIERYGIPGPVLMENAGRGVVDVMDMCGIDGTVAVCCGRGNNAGDGFVIARHLEIRGYTAEVVLSGDPAELTGDAALNYRILQKTDVPIHRYYPDDPSQFECLLADSEWVVDAMLGTGVRGRPRAPMDEMLLRMNDYGTNRLAVDIPSGLDCETGEAAPGTFKADHTCTFVALKHGLLANDAREYVGQIHIVDIGIPPKLVYDV